MFLPEPQIPVQAWAWPAVAVRPPDQFTQAEEPEWVTAWLAKRTEKAEKKEQKAKSETPVDEAAQAKRQEKRHQKVLGGISDLEVWMKDLVRNGFLNVPERAYTLFDNMARRMVDAQAPGLAGRLRAMEAIDFDSESWKSDLTESMGRLYLLMQSYRNMDGRDTHADRISPVQGQRPCRRAGGGQLARASQAVP